MDPKLSLRNTSLRGLTVSSYSVLAGSAWQFTAAAQAGCLTSVFAWIMISCGRIVQDSTQIEKSQRISVTSMLKNTNQHPQRNRRKRSSITESAEASETIQTRQKRPVLKSSENTADTQGFPKQICFTLSVDVLLKGRSSRRR